MNSPLDVFNCPLEGINLIEASAGTGKTWNICGLYLRLLLERELKVDQILVVTFTNAATAELRERIRQRLVQMAAHLRGHHSGDAFITGLHSALNLDDAPASTLSARQALIEAALSAFDEASIFTIHGFCQRALADTAFAAHIPLQNELLADDSALRSQVVNDFWRRRVAIDDMPEVLAAWLLARKDSPESFARLLSRRLSRPTAIQRWPEAINSPQALDITGLQLLFEQVCSQWSQRSQQISDKLRQSRPELNGNTYSEPRLERALNACEQSFVGGTVSDLLAADTELLALVSSNKLVAGTKKGRVCPTDPFFDLVAQLLNAQSALASQLALARLALIRDMLDECTAALDHEKRRRHQIGYDDMLQRLYAALHAPQTPWLADALHQRFPAALIDEFQDTDPVQFGIFERIYRHQAAPVFLVGDPKQSIYAFRSADLHTYLQAREQAQQRYTLDRNQRSAPALVKALNTLFSVNPRLFMLQGLDYHQVGTGERKRDAFQGAASAGAALQLWALPGLIDDQPVVSLGDARKLAAQACAAEIARLIQAGRFGDARIGERPLQAGDCAVLVRTHAEGALMRLALAQLGLASVERSARSVFVTPDAEELERILAAILEPGRDSLLKAALATETIGLDASEIAALDLHESSTATLAQQFAALRQDWLERGAGFMLRRLLNRQTVAARLLSRPDGERRLTNLLHLIEVLHQAGGDQRSPEALLRWFRLQREQSIASEQAQLRLESDENLVQIITIHAAKGLEYPVVFCPFLWRDTQSGGGALPDGAEYHDEAGQLLIDWRKGLDPAFDEARVKLDQQLERSAEFLRLVYVALTRAVHRCVLVIGCQRGGKSRGADAKPEDGSMANASADTRGLLNWLVAGAGIEPHAWSKAGLSLQSVGDAWRRLSADAPEHIALHSLPTVPVTGPVFSPAEAASFVALAGPARIPSAWRIGSFSALVHGASHELAAADRDLRADPRTDTFRLPAALPDTDILRFARGPQAGECLHALLETIDFTDPSGWPAAIEAVLRNVPAHEHGPLMLAGLLANLMNTPLPVGTGNPLLLSRLSAEKRLTEMEFHLGSRQLRDHDLNRLLSAHGLQVPRLGFAPLKGYLKGFIDLVFEHEGRFFILDWKSNHLGDTPQDYNRARMADEMAHHGYSLQALIYCLALDRFLRRRVPDYQREQHFGGAVYLFIRAVRPAWILADGSPAGLHVERPSDALLDQLDDLLNGEKARA